MMLECLDIVKLILGTPLIDKFNNCLITVVVKCLIFFFDNIVHGSLAKQTR